jgi:hypothetical protein
VAYLLMRWLFGLVALVFRGDRAKDAELGVCGWLVLLGRSPASKDPSCSCCGTRSPCCAAPIPGPGWTGPTAQSLPR